MRGQRGYSLFRNLRIQPKTRFQPRLRALESAARRAPNDKAPQRPRHIRSLLQGCLQIAGQLVLMRMKKSTASFAAQ